MSAEIPAVRPAVISTGTRDCLEEYRGFRHIVRNVYTFNLRPARLQELTSELLDCYRLVAHDLEQFSELLEHLTGQDRTP
jgi:uncharacterized protein YutE (UPF0331/DUF86 family)